ncbi:MAG: beta-propeller fold lactonase family protein, partial [Planctomycetaceae bacterium]|nr:beta-propeller fold lactonase family protein [Planctomycetaceae bacterium]
ATSRRTPKIPHLFTNSRKRPTDERSRYSMLLSESPKSLQRTVSIAIFSMLALLFLIQGSPSQAGTSNSLMDISADGTLLACSNRDSGTVTIIDLKDRQKVHEVEVGHDPEGVTFLGETHQLAVAVYGDDVIHFLDGQSGEITGTTQVFDEPYGLVSSPDGKRLWATLEFPGQVIEIDPSSRKVTRTTEAGQFVRGLAVANNQLFVTEYYTGVVKALDVDSFQVVDEWSGSAQDNLARQITIHPSRAKAYVPHQRSLTTVTHGSGSIFPYVSVIDTDAGEGKRRKRVQMDSLRGTYVVANPWEVAVSPDGQTLYAIFGGTDDMFVCDVLDDNYRELEYQSLLRTGSNPRAVRVSPDGETFFIYNALDFRVDAYDADSLKLSWSVQVTECPLPNDVLLGKKLFYTANPPMTSRRWISCSSCHPDGDPDGRTWQQPEGLRNTQPLFGLKETHPIHWSADRDEVQDFEHTIRSPLMGGRGLIRGPVSDSLGDKNGGRSEMLDALAAYTNSHAFRPSPFAKTGLSDAAQRGKALFFSEKTKCASCHSGPFYTDRQMHDVGTIAEDPSEKIGPEFDTPTLLGVYRSAPYLHHGMAPTLEAMLTQFNPDNKHGVTSHLSESEINDLVEFLKALPFE